MIAALSGFGLDAPIAISAVLTFRLATFWLPIAPGWATFVWTERRNDGARSERSEFRTKQALSFSGDLSAH